MAKLELPKDPMAEHLGPDDEDQADLKDQLKGEIAVGVSEAGVLRKTLEVTIPRPSIDRELDKEYGQIISDAVVPGFRKGRAPRRLVEKRYGQEIGAQVQTRLISNGYLAAIEKQELKVLGDPMVWVKVKDKGADGGGQLQERLVDMPTALQHLRLPEEGELSFKCEVEVKPNFDLPSLEGVAIERPVLSITDRDVDEQINRILARIGTWAPVPDAAVQEDDLLICDVVLRVDGQEIKKLENHTLAAREQALEGVVFEDFGEKVSGARVGDKRSIHGMLPDDYEVQTLRGKKAEFDVTLNEIKRLRVPPLDKGFLDSMGFDTKKEFEDSVRKSMEGQLEQEIQRGMRDQIRKYLLNNTKLDLPEGLSARQTNRAALRAIVDLQRRGVPMAEIEKHADELRTSAREKAVAELKLHFIMEEIAAKLDVDVKEEEINAQIAAMARVYNKRFDRVRDDLARNNGIESLYLDIRDEKCIDAIIAKAQVTDAAVVDPPKKPGPKTKPAAAAPAASKTKPKAAKSGSSAAKKKSK